LKVKNSGITTEAGSRTKLTITQDNIISEEEAKHSENNWTAVLSKLKEILEK